jgi:type III pantothenate kinase
MYLCIVKKRYVNLIIDIGNTAAKLVAFDGNTPIDEVRTSNETLEGLPDFIRKYPFDKGAIASVYGITEQVNDHLNHLDFPLLHIDTDTPTPLINEYKTPKSLGIDRLAAAVGAHTECPHHDLLVIDSGTCLTYEFVDKRGHYWGGCISPGLRMRLQSLHTFTAKLPFIEPEGDVPTIGYDTATAIRSGVIQGMKAEIEGRIRSFQEKHPSLLVFLTGGDTFDFDDKIKSIIFADKYIVPKGLNRILEYNNE